MEIESEKYVEENKNWMSIKPVLLSTREMWRAGIREPQEPLPLPVSNVFYSATRTPPCMFKGDCRKKIARIQAVCVQVHRIYDIRYSFIVAGDGRVYEGRGWKSPPHLPLKYRHLATKSIYIGYLGSFNKFYCPDIMTETDENFVKFAVNMGYVTKKFLEINLDDRVYFV